MGSLFFKLHTIGMVVSSNELENQIVQQTEENQIYIRKYAGSNEFHMNNP